MIWCVEKLLSTNRVACGCTLTARTSASTGYTCGDFHCSGLFGLNEQLVGHVNLKRECITIGDRDLERRELN